LAQDESYFFLDEAGVTTKLRFHDYGQIYERPGLYEQLFYDRLKCNSPQKVAQILKEVVDSTSGTFTQLRILDVGAGNGLMGEAMSEYGFARLIGVDIIEEAHMAQVRDRPWLYDAYYVTDLTSLPMATGQELANWKPDCMTLVAALGFGDIPPRAFFTAFNLIEVAGYVAFNIKETFLDNRDTSGFSAFIRQLILAEYLDLHHLERYRHRISIDGKPLYYFAVVGRKNQHIPEDFLRAIVLSS
jgi:predicted TPR repeat methyltransferase